MPVTRCAGRVCARLRRCAIQSRPASACSVQLIRICVSHAIAHHCRRDEPRAQTAHELSVRRKTTGLVVQLSEMQNDFPNWDQEFNSGKVAKPSLDICFRMSALEETGLYR